MAGDWMDDRERQIREQGWQARDYRRDEGSARREGRSWDGEGRADPYAARRGGPGGGYQGRVYEGYVPPRFGSQDHTRGSRSYDSGREPAHGEDYGPASRGEDDGFSPTRAAYRRAGLGDPGFDDYGRDAYGRPLSSGTGGYDDQRRYGDGRPEARGERFEDAGRKSGEFLHRAGRKVASWFAGAGDEGGRDAQGEDRGHRGRGPKAYKRSDERITEDANERLTEDRWLDASDIIVVVSVGEVTLSGTVEDRDAKHRAERIVEDISGVSHVQNNLRIAGSGPDSQDRGGQSYGSQSYGGAAGGEAGANGAAGSAGQSTAGRKD